MVSFKNTAIRGRNPKQTKTVEINLYFSFLGPGVGYKRTPFKVSSESSLNKIKKTNIKVKQSSTGTIVSGSRGDITRL